MERNKAILLTSQNVHRIIITSVVLAMKFLDDLYYTNSYYAKISGIPCAEVCVCVNVRARASVRCRVLACVRART